MSITPVGGWRNEPEGEIVPRTVEAAKPSVVIVHAKEKSTSSFAKAFFGCLGVICALLCIGFLTSFSSAFIKGCNTAMSATPDQSATTTQTSAHQEISDAPDDPMQIDVKSFLAEYRANGETANAKYKGKKVELTGVATGVFVPSFVTSMRMEQTGGHADAFITMGGPVPQSPEETLFLPGIAAYSETRALFGQTSFTPALLSLRRGVTVTLLCTCEQGHRASDMGAMEYADSPDYSVQLDDCVLEKTRRTPPQNQDYTDEAAKLYSLMDKNFRDHPGDGEGRNARPPRLVASVSPTYPADAWAAHISGTVTVGATVDSSGKLVNIHIIKSASPSLDTAALQAFSQYQFEPAHNSITGAATSFTVTQELNFPAH